MSWPAVATLTTKRSVTYIVKFKNNSNPGSRKIFLPLQSKVHLPLEQLYPLHSLTWLLAQLS